MTHMLEMKQNAHLHWEGCGSIKQKKYSAPNALLGIPIHFRDSSKHQVTDLSRYRSQQPDQWLLQNQ